MAAEYESKRVSTVGCLAVIQHHPASELKLAALIRSSYE